MSGAAGLGGNSHRLVGVSYGFAIAAALLGARKADMIRSAGDVNGLLSSRSPAEHRSGTEVQQYIVTLKNIAPGMKPADAANATSVALVENLDHLLLALGRTSERGVSVTLRPKFRCFMLAGGQ